MKFKFEAPEYLDKEQVDYLVKCNIAVVHNDSVIWVFNPKLFRKIKKKTVDHLEAEFESYQQDMKERGSV